MNGSNVREDVWTKIVLMRFDPHDVVILMNVCKFILRCLVDGHSYPVVWNCTKVLTVLGKIAKRCILLILIQKVTGSMSVCVCVCTQWTL